MEVVGLLNGIMQIPQCRIQVQWLELMNGRVLLKGALLCCTSYMRESNLVQILFKSQNWLWEIG